MIIAFIFIACIPLMEAILFGGGCGCQQCPQLSLPCPPPLPPPPCPCLPQLPPLQLPCPPQPCGCRRKKRSAALAVSGESSANGGAHLCNNKDIRKIILKNLSADPKMSKEAIHAELKAKKPGNFVVLCSQAPFSFITDSTNYCVDGSANQTCHVFEI